MSAGSDETQSSRKSERSLVATFNEVKKNKKMFCNIQMFASPRLNTAVRRFFFF